MNPSDKQTNQSLCIIKQEKHPNQFHSPITQLLTKKVLTSALLLFQGQSLDEGFLPNLPLMALYSISSILNLHQYMEEAPN